MRFLATRRGFALGAAAVVGGARPAFSQFNRSTTRLVVGFPPGGSGDTFARIIQTPLSEELGRAIVIDNRPGAGGLTAAESFVRAEPDGSALLLATGSAAISAPIIRKDPPYDAVRDFAWIAHLSLAPFVIAVNPKLPVTDLPGLVAYAKARPSDLTYGSAGIGTTVHLAGELFKERAGVDIRHVPYRGSGPAVTDTISGQIHSIIETYSTLLPFHRDGTLRILAVMAEEPSMVASEIPTARAAAGLDIIAGTCNLLAAPLRTPQTVLGPIAAAIDRVMARPAIRDQFLATDIQPITGSSPEKARTYVASEVARWKPVVERLGLSL